MKLQGLVAAVVEGNEEADKLLTALTVRHIQVQTLLQDFYCRPSVPASLMKLNYRVLG